MKAAGRGNLQLFKIQSELDIDLRRNAVDRLYESLGMAKPAAKKVQSYDMPLIPQQEDYHFFPFRQLSATTVGAGTYKATDFSADNVLKRSKNFLKGKPAFLNHYQETGTEIGFIGDTEWQAAYKHPSGAMIPAGIDAPFILDAKLTGNADLIRKMSGPTSPINACSVSVLFEWEASHEFERDGDFFWHLGEMIDDDMVRRVVTEVVDYYESSLVWLGADPYAKMLDQNGQLVVIDREAAFSKKSFSMLPESEKYDTGRKFYVFDSLDKEKLLHLSKSKENFSAAKPTNIITMNEELLKFLAEKYGTTLEKLKSGEFKIEDFKKFVVKPEVDFNKMKSESDFQASEAKVVALTADVEKIKLEKAALETAKAALETEKVQLVKDAKIGVDVLTAARAEAKRVYGLFSKGKPDASIEAELTGEVDLSKLEKKIEMFGGTAVTKFGASCNTCKGTDISFRSSAAKEDDATKKKEVSSDYESSFLK